MNVFGASSFRPNEMAMASEVFFRDIAYDDRRGVIVLVETLESLPYHGYSGFSGY